MSIWCSYVPIGWDDEGEAVGGKVIDDGGVRDPRPHWVGGEVRSYAEGWSNHYPNADDGVELPASLDLAHIAPFCVPGNEGVDEEDGSVGGWLRLSIASPSAVTLWKTPDKPQPDPRYASVILDEAAARALAKDLRRWLKRPKRHPKEAS